MNRYSAKLLGDYLYKPSYEHAKDLLLQQLQPPEETEFIASSNARGRICSVDIRMPSDFPASIRARADGHVVMGDPIGDYRTRFAQTGEPVPEDARYLLFDERYDPQLDDELPAHPGGHGNLVRKGAEWAQGDLVVAADQLIERHHVATLKLLQDDQLAVYRQPKVQVLMFAEQAESSAIASWLTDFLHSFGSVAVQFTIVQQLDELPQQKSDADLLVLVSDGGPGRYGASKRLLEPGVDWLQGVFWKADVHPGRHVGMARLQDVPMFILPDVFSKTVLSSLSFLSFAMSQLCRRPLQTLRATWSQDPITPSKTPFVIPVRLQLQDGGWKAQPLDAKKAFSARGVVAANGFVFLQEAAFAEQEASFYILPSAIVSG